MVEHSAVNRRVVSSSLTRGAKIRQLPDFLYMEYNLYILRSIKVYKYYTGVSKNSHRRLEYHNTIERGFTSRYRPWEIVFTKKFKTKAEAMAAEKKVKGWKSKKMIEKLINGEIIL